MGILVDIVVEFVVGLFIPSRKRRRGRSKGGRLGTQRVRSSPDSDPH